MADPQARDDVPPTSLKKYTSSGANALRTICLAPPDTKGCTEQGPSPAPHPEKRQRQQQASAAKTTTSTTTTTTTSANEGMHHSNGSQRPRTATSLSRHLACAAWPPPTQHRPLSLCPLPASEGRRAMSQHLACFLLGAQTNEAKPTRPTKSKPRTWGPEVQLKVGVGDDVAVEASCTRHAHSIQFHSRART